MTNKSSSAKHITHWLEPPFEMWHEVLDPDGCGEMKFFAGRVIGDEKKFLADTYDNLLLLLRSRSDDILEL